ncbi:hypothetical protein [Cereibacter sphaeroides]|uniref:hypothetical protein n=1 Tax=Cereibacter sphaeroides TaxID=1063 RepID=UPI003FCEAEAD
MQQAEISGFRAESCEILQAEAIETSGFLRGINRFVIVQAGLLTDDADQCRPARTAHCRLSHQ